MFENFRKVFLKILKRKIIQNLCGIYWKPDHSPKYQKDQIGSGHCSFSLPYNRTPLIYEMLVKTRNSFQRINTAINSSNDNTHLVLHILMTSMQKHYTHIHLEMDFQIHLHFSNYNHVFSKIEQKRIDEREKSDYECHNNIFRRRLLFNWRIVMKFKLWKSWNKRIKIIEKTF